MKTAGGSSFPTGATAVETHWPPPGTINPGKRKPVVMDGKKKKRDQGDMAQSGRGRKETYEGGRDGKKDGE